MTTETSSSVGARSLTARPLDARRGPGAILAAALAAATVILVVQLFLPPVVGLANNGDFEKVMGYAGFQYLPGAPSEPAERFYSWIQTRFAVVTPGWYRSGFWTSETALALIGRGLNALIRRDGLFDLRCLAAVHAALFLAALGFLLRATRAWSGPRRLAAAALLVFVFTDVGYVAPFNSFYAQTASLLFLLPTLAAAAVAVERGGLRGGRLAAYFLFAALFVASKPQEVLHGPLLAFFGLRLASASAPRDRPGSGPRNLAAWVLASGLCLFSIAYGARTPESYRRLARYDAVFLELLPHSPAPEEDLRRLGLDPAWAGFAGKPAYPPGFPPEALEKLSYGRLMALYASHPARVVGLIRRAAPSAFILRPPALGNFEKSSGAAPHAKSNAFALWSALRQRVSPVALPALVLLGAAALLSAAAGYREASPRGRLAREGILLLATMAAVEFLVCVLADYLFGLPRHLYLFQALTDMLLIALVLRWAGPTATESA